MPRVTRVREQRLIALPDLARFYGMPRPRPEGNQVVLRQESGAEWVFQLDGRQARFNGIAIWLHEPVRQHRRDWVLSEKDWQSVIDPLLRPNRYLAGVGHGRIIVDAGHGGSDEGARGSLGTQEKAVTLAVAKRVRDRLSAQGLDVLMTREHDRTVSLDDRVRLMSENRGDLFVSIHFNASSNAEARGSETFVLPMGGMPGTYDQNDGRTFPTGLTGNQFDAANMILAYTVQRHLIGQSRNEDRGVRRARFRVLRDATCPAILVECAFLSHPPEERKVHQQAYLDRLADGIVQGVAEYMATVKRTQLTERKSVPSE